jgi:integrase
VQFAFRSPHPPRPLATGLRHGELLGLRWEDVEIKEGEGRLSVRRALVQSRPKGSGGTGYAFGTPKTGRARVVSFGVKVAALLREHRKHQVKEKLALGPCYRETGLVFTDVEGGMLPPWKSGRIFNRLAREAGLHGFRFHDLRHTAATLSLQEGVHPRIVQEMLGHSKISQTLDTYSHVLPNMQAEAARRLDSALF